MTLLAGGIIDQARGRHAAFDATRHPNKVVLQFLSAYVRELHGRVTKLNPEALRTNTDTALPLAVHADGIALGDERMVVEVVAKDADDNEFPVDLIPATHRLDRGIRAASAWQIGSTLYLTSPASLWQRMAVIGIASVPIPVTLAALTSAIALPDTAEKALVEQAALFMAKRSDTDTKIDRAAFAAEAEKSETLFLDDISNRMTAQVFRTRDVYDP